MVMLVVFLLVAMGLFYDSVPGTEVRYGSIQGHEVWHREFPRCDDILLIGLCDLMSAYSTMQWAGDNPTICDIAIKPLLLDLCCLFCLHEDIRLPSGQ